MDTPPLPLSRYRGLIDLDAEPNIVADPQWRRRLPPLLASLGAESPDRAVDDLTHLQATLAPIDSGRLGPEVLVSVEQILAGATHERPSVDPLELPSVAEQGPTGYPVADEVSVWVGDITMLRADAIVNAANSQLHGCRIPFHFCIDYAIHGWAGPRLRVDCATLVEAQGGLEPVGTAKLTRGYALPAPFVIHTVGPRLATGNDPTTNEMAQLRSCYRSCLDAAASVDSIASVAFCAISTGVFAFPKPAAATIALETVADWLSRHPRRFDRIVFNLFSNEDAAHYEQAIDGYRR